jgi:uncharacterized protein YeaO (DUF488 family)
MPVTVKRVYDPPDAADGVRVLVDRLWPRGLAKDKAKIDRWAKELAPSDALRRWFGHDPAKWGEFRKKYLAELRGNSESVREISAQARRRQVTLLYAARDELHNNAVVLAKHLNLKKGTPANPRRPRAKGVAGSRQAGKNARP